jgi:hypothetical protein
VVFDQPGEYRLTAAVDAAPDDVVDRYVTVTRPRQELIDPQADPTAMATLAGRERALAPAAWATLIEAIPDGVRRPVEPATRPLWSLWPTAVVLAMLLMIEWTVRKKYNMT